jgi:exodeoxyribonuclease V alpha subunit
VGSVGTNAINLFLQEETNPPAPNKLEIKIKDRCLRQGDKVIQTVNNYEIDVFNGEIGKIITVNPEEKEMVVEFGDNEKKVLYKKVQILELKLAYSISIHKSQGSGFDVVIIPLTNQHFHLLYRQLVYTGLTRAKKLCIFLGQRSALRTSIKNLKSIHRQTSLVELLSI